MQVPIRGDNAPPHQGAGQDTWKFGAQYRRSRNDDLPAGNAGGTFGFTPNAAGDAFAALLLGYPASGSIDQASTIRSLAAALGVFAQDDWRVSARLTINLGLRWDLDTPRHEGINNQQNSHVNAWFTAAAYGRSRVATAKAFTRTTSTTTTSARGLDSPTTLATSGFFAVEHRLSIPGSTTTRRRSRSEAASPTPVRLLPSMAGAPRRSSSKTACPLSRRRPRIV